MKCESCKYSIDNNVRDMYNNHMCYCIAHDCEMSMYAFCTLFSNRDRRNIDADNRLYHRSSEQTR